MIPWLGSIGIWALLDLRHLIAKLQSWTKVLRHFIETNAFKLTIIFCVWMKTPFSSVILPPFPQPMLQTSRGCLFVSKIEKGGRGGGGGATFHEGRGENSHQGKKGWSLSYVSTTSVHDCRLVIWHPLLRAPHYLLQALSFCRREMRSSIPGFY